MSLKIKSFLGIKMDKGVQQFVDTCECEHTQSLHQLLLADEISDGQKNEAFSPELSWAKESYMHSTGDQKINMALYTSSIYLLLSSAFPLYPLLAHT